MFCFAAAHPRTKRKALVQSETWHNFLIKLRLDLSDVYKSTAECEIVTAQHALARVFRKRGRHTPYTRHVARI
ncbi:unnamed protein product [Ixodes pacificus]